MHWRWNGCEHSVQLQILAVREMLSAQILHSASPVECAAVNRSTRVWFAGAGIGVEGVEVPDVDAPDEPGGTNGVAVACR